MAMVAVLLCHSGDMKNENIFVFSEKKSERERWSYDGSWYLSTYDELDTTATLSLFRLKPTVSISPNRKRQIHFLAGTSLLIVMILTLEILGM